MRSAEAAILAAALSVCGEARAERVVAGVGPEALIAAFAGAGLTTLEEATADPAAPSVLARRPDGLAVQATFLACANETACQGLALSAVLPARSVALARKVAAAVEARALGFDAWVQADPPAAVIDVYLAFDGGVSDQLLPATLKALDRTLDEAKALLLQQDPRAAELWRP